MAKTVQFVDKKTNEDIYPVIDSSKIDKIQSFIDSSQLIRYNASTDGTVMLQYKNNGYNYTLPLYVGNCYFRYNSSLTTIEKFFDASSWADNSSDINAYISRIDASIAELKSNAALNVFKYDYDRTKIEVPESVNPSVFINRAKITLDASLSEYLYQQSWTTPEIGSLFTEIITKIKQLDASIK